MNEKTNVEKSAPIAIENNKVIVHLDPLNEVLKKYNLRVGSLDDIYIDREESQLNSSDVLKIICQKEDSDSDWNPKWFFEELKKMEDDFEQNSEEVNAAEFDRSDFILTLTLNHDGGILEKQLLETGGTVDHELEAIVDEKLKNNPDEVYKMVGLTPGAGTEVQAREKALKHFQGIKNAAPHVWVYIHGRKLDLVNGATLDTVYLQQLFVDKFSDHAIANLRGAENDNFTKAYANNKAVLAVDMIRGMAMENTGTPFIVTEAIIEDVIKKTVE